MGLFRENEGALDKIEVGVRMILGQCVEYVLNGDLFLLG